MQPDAALQSLPDFKQILLALWRRKWPLIGVTLVPALLGWFYIYSLPSQYVATASILVGRQELKFTNFPDIQNTFQLDDQMVQTQVGLITSPRLARETAEDAKLLEHWEFKPQPEEQDKKRIRRKLTENFLRRLDVTPDSNSRVIRISFSSQDPELAAKAVNAHTENYLDYSIAIANERTVSLSKWLDEQVKRLEKETDERAAKAQEFRAEAGLVLGQGSEELIYQQISDTAAQLVPVQTRRLELQARMDAIKNADSRGLGEQVGEIVGSPLIQNLKSQEAVTQQRLQGLTATYGANHPSVVSAQRELTQLRAKIAQESGTISGSTANDLKATAQQEELLSATLLELEKKANALRKKSITLEAYDREVRASQEALDNFLSRKKEIQSQLDLKRPDASVIAWADIPSKPSKPNKPVLAFVVLVFSSMLGLAAVLILEMRRSGFTNQEELRAAIGRRPLGIVPKVGSPLAMVLDSPESVYTESIKKIYMTALMRRGSEANQKGLSLLITSSQPNEGKSVLTLSLAYYMAAIGKKVVVIDGDPRQASIHTMAGVRLRPGFTDLLAQRCTLEEAIVRDNRQMIDIIPAGARRILAPDALSSDTTRQLIDILRSRYDYVLFDSPPVLALADASVLSTIADETIMVAEWGKTPKKKVAYTVKTIEEMSKPVLGVVLTKVNLAQYALYDYGDAGMYYGANMKYYSS